MKKLILLILLIFTLCIVTTSTTYAQPKQLWSVKAGDSLINTDTLVKYFNLTDDYASVVISQKVSKVSGTVAGTIHLYSSNDNSNWEVRDSLVLADQATNVKNWRFTAPADYYWKIEYISAGTQAYIPRVYFNSVRYHR